MESLYFSKVADYDVSFIYGCGLTINQNMANYDSANPLGLSLFPFTSPVGYYPAYGYGVCDMAGNVWEWTSSCYYEDCDPEDRVVRGGGWFTIDYYCSVSSRTNIGPGSLYGTTGFRVCR